MLSYMGRVLAVLLKNATHSEKSRHLSVEVEDFVLVHSALKQCNGCQVSRYTNTFNTRLQSPDTKHSSKLTQSVSFCDPKALGEGAYVTPCDPMSPNLTPNDLV